MKSNLIAHVRFDRDNVATIHPLEDHLRDVGRLAGGLDRLSQFSNKLLENWAGLDGGCD